MYKKWPKKKNNRELYFNKNSEKTSIIETFRSSLVAICAVI